MQRRKAAQAQAVSDQILSNVSAQTVGECSTIKITFNVRVQIVSHFPENSGRELHIRIDPLDGSNVFNDARESLRVPAGVPDLSSISFEKRPVAGQLTVAVFWAASQFRGGGQHRPASRRRAHCEIGRSQQLHRHRCVARILHRRAAAGDESRYSYPQRAVRGQFPLASPMKLAR